MKKQSMKPNLARLAMMLPLGKSGDRAPGFTLIEMLVVVIFAGILMAIAAPSWSVLVARQRTGTVRSEITQVLRKAQADAIRTRTARAVVFDTNAAPLPRAAIVTVPFGTPTGPLFPTPENVETSSPGSWQALGSDIRSGVLTLRGFGTATGSSTTLVFDSNGAVATAQSVPGMTSQIEVGTPFIMAVQTGNSTQTQNRVFRCVIVDTLLGSIRTADGQTNCTR
jgi:prepilin-type N-terminal cleavage/methylation domain-containing protein